MVLRSQNHLDLRLWRAVSRVEGKGRMQLTFFLWILKLGNSITTVAIFTDHELAEVPRPRSWWSCGLGVMHRRGQHV